MVSHREVCAFRKRPRQVRVSISWVATSFALSSAEPGGLDQSAVRSEIPHLFESPDLTDLIHHRERQDFADSPHRQQRSKLVSEFRPDCRFFFDDPDLAVQRLHRFQQTGDP